MGLFTTYVSNVHDAEFYKKGKFYDAVTRLQYATEETKEVK